MPDLTVAQNIFMGREPRIGGWFLVRASAQPAGGRAGRATRSAPRRAQPLVGGLTVANQQMVEIAKALSLRRSGADHGRAHRSAQRRRGGNPARAHRRFVREGTGVIYISHRMDELKAVSDRITVIRDGRYVETLRDR